MSYNVRWNPAAERQLARIWTDAADKSAVTAAADAVDAAIQRDPTQVGESRPGRTRIAFARPLGFLFDVYPDTQ
jgi:plasmid stabilization system protein ParE